MLLRVTVFMSYKSTLEFQLPFFTILLDLEEMVRAYNVLSVLDTADRNWLVHIRICVLLLILVDGSFYHPPRSELKARFGDWMVTNDIEHFV